jgi:23S rRNA (guanosine2251-2'-O)-methyltransferase
VSEHFIYGLHPIQERLRAGLPIDRLYVLRGRRDREIDDLARAVSAAGAAVRYEVREQLDRVAGTTKHQGVIAMIGEESYLTLERLLAQIAGRAKPACLVILDEVEDPQNLGAVIRTAEAAGAQGVLIPERRAAGLTPAAVKASAGAAAHLPVVRVGNLVQAMEALKAAKFWLTGLDAAAATRYTAVDWTVPSVIVAGSEGKGLRPLVRQHCDQVAAIPLLGSVGSLNVSVAVGVVLYEVVRQRAKKS